MRLLNAIKVIHDSLLRRIRVLMRIFRMLNDSGKHIQTIAATNRGPRRIRNARGYLKEKQYDVEENGQGVCLPSRSSVFFADSHSGSRSTLSVMHDTGHIGSTMNLVEHLPHDFLVNVLAAIATLLISLVAGWLLYLFMSHFEASNATRNKNNHNNKFDISKELISDLETEVSFHSLFERLESLGYDIQIEHREASSVSSRDDNSFLRPVDSDSIEALSDSKREVRQTTDQSEQEPPLIDILSSVLEYYKLKNHSKADKRPKAQRVIRERSRRRGFKDDQKFRNESYWREEDSSTEVKRDMTPTAIQTSSGVDVIHLKRLNLFRQSEDENLPLGYVTPSPPDTRRKGNRTPLLDMSNVSDHRTTSGSVSDPSLSNFERSSIHDSLITNPAESSTEITAKKSKNFAATPLTPNKILFRSSRPGSQGNRMEDDSIVSIQTTPSYMKHKQHKNGQISELNEDLVKGRYRRHRQLDVLSKQKNEIYDVPIDSANENRCFYRIQELSRRILMADNNISFDFFSVKDSTEFDRSVYLEELIEESKTMTLPPKKWVEMQLNETIFRNITSDITNQIRKLRALLSYDFDGDDNVLKSLISQYKISVGKNLLKIIDLLSSDDIENAKAVVLLIEDYMSFSVSQEVSIATYKACFQKLVSKIGSNYEIDLLLSKCLISMSIALDLPMIEKTLYEILEELLEQAEPEKQTLLLKCIKFYICFNRESIIGEFIVNPFESKVHCNGSKLIKCIERMIPRIIEVSKPLYESITEHSKRPEYATHIHPLLEELIDVFLIIVDIFINTSEISPSIQYELLTNDITSMYNMISQVADNKTTILEPPQMKELMPPSRDKDGN